MDCNYRLLQIDYGLLWVVIAHYFGLLGFPGRNILRVGIDVYTGLIVLILLQALCRIHVRGAKP